MTAKKLKLKGIRLNDKAAESFSPAVDISEQFNISMGSPGREMDADWRRRRKPIKLDDME